MKKTAILLSFLLLAGAAPLAAQETGRSSTQELIEQLGDADYKVRKAAEKQLLSLGGKALEMLEKNARDHDDPEVQWRAGRIARRIERGAKDERGLSRRRPDRDGGEGRELVRKKASRWGVDTRDRQRILDEVMKSLDRAFDRRGFDAEVGKEIERAMAEARKSLRSLRRLQRDDIFEQLGPKVGGRSEIFESKSKSSVKISQGPDGVRVEIVEEDKDGNETKKVYEAEDMESFEKKHPGVLKKNNLRLHFGGDFPPDFELPRLRDFKPFLRFDRNLDIDIDHDVRRLRKGLPGIEGRIEEKSSGKKLGFYVGELSPAVRDYLGLEPGAGLMVEGIAPDSLAHKLGLKKGDIVVRVGKRKIHAPADVAAALEEIGEGQVHVGVIRRGQHLGLGLGKSRAKGEKKADVEKKAPAVERRLRIR